jgi:hypothetical protein
MAGCGAFVKTSEIPAFAGMTNLGSFLRENKEKWEFMGNMGYRVIYGKRIGRPWMYG